MRSFTSFLSEDITDDQDNDVPTSKPITFAFGRMNPPTTGHEALVNKVKSVAREHRSPHEIMLSSTHDPTKNPLQPEQKVAHARRMFPGTNIASGQGGLVQHLTRLCKEGGHDELHLVAGGDRLPEYQKIIDKYNNKPDGKGNVPFAFKKVQLHSAGDRDPDSEGVKGMSASKMRASAKKGDFASFRSGVPAHVPDEHVQQMFTDVQSGQQKPKKK